MKPAHVNTSNTDQVWVTLYAYVLRNFPTPKLRIGKTVRISKYKNILQKGYEGDFMEEILEVMKVFNMYEIEDHEEEPVTGKFYVEELSAVDKKDDMYRVKKILKREKVKGANMVLVKWLGYDNTHDSWIPEENIQVIY